MTSLSAHAHCRVFRRVSLATLLSCLTLAQLHAQTAASTTTAADLTEKTDETIVLSPFVVSAEDSRGYQATSTLAGTRLRSSLKDVASPISVLTVDLLNDVAATNFQEAMLYSVNVENENEYAPDDTEGESIASTTQNRIRGIGVGSQTRGFFKTNFRSDTYNSDRLTVSSGPNAILFGLGSPAGIIDATPITAQLGRQSGSVSVRFDTDHGHRESADLNVPIIKDRFGVRVAGLNQKTRTFRKPEFDDEQRYFVAATLQPFKNTVIKGSYESIENDRVRARETLMQDNITDWIALGKPLYDVTTDRWTLDNGSTWVARPDLDSWRNTGGIGFDNRVFIAGGNRGGDQTQARPWNGMGLSYSPTNPYPKTFSDDRYVSSDINYYGLGDQTRLEGDIGTVILEQKVTDDLYVEAAHNRETYSRLQHDPLRAGLSSIQADVNWYLPYPIDSAGNPIVGTPILNPNVGRSFIESQYIGYTQDLTLQTSRAMASYSLDFTKHKLGWLGRYNFGVMWQRETTESHKQKRFMRNSDDYWFGTEANPNSVRTRYYLDLPGLGGDASGVKYPGSFQQPPWPTAIGSSDAPEQSRIDVTGKLFVTQARLLKDSLVLTYGYRDDTQRVRTKTFNVTQDPVRHTWSAAPRGEITNNQAGITRNYGVVYHTPLKGLSLLYNRANAFNPQGNYATWFGDPLPPGSGKSEDYGVSLSLLNDKLQVRLTRFNSTSIDNVEFDWYYEEPKWSVVGVMDADWGMVTNYARRLAAETGNSAYLADVNQVDARPGFSWDGVRATRDYEAQGYEAELFYQPTPQWDFRLTVAQNEATNIRVVPGLQQYVASRMAVWEKYYGYPAWGQWDAVMPAWDPNWATNPNSTGYQLLNPSAALPRLESFKASEGSRTARGREWRVNVIANHQFTGALRGFSVGGATRWRSSDTIGYHGKPNPLVPSGGLEVEDINRPISGPEVFEIDSWINYERDFRLAGRKYTWSAQLNVRNLLDDDKIVPVSAYTTGENSAYTRTGPRTIILTNTFKF